MALSQTVFQTVTCNGPDCTKTLTFDASKEQQVMAQPENAWINSTRVVTDLRTQIDPMTGQPKQKRIFLYCSDECEIKNAGTGVHNPPQPKKIISDAGTPEQVAAAAAAAKALADSTETLKSGSGGKIVVG